MQLDMACLLGERLAANATRVGFARDELLVKSAWVARSSLRQPAPGTGPEPRLGSRESRRLDAYQRRAGCNEILEQFDVAGGEPLRLTERPWNLRPALSTCLGIITS
jgi:hypothetical protein